MAADDEQALLAFQADLGDGDDPVDLAFRPPPSWGSWGASWRLLKHSQNLLLQQQVWRLPAGQKAMFFVDNKEPREHETVSGIRILRGLYFSSDIA